MRKENGTGGLPTTALNSPLSSRVSQTREGDIGLALPQPESRTDCLSRSALYRSEVGAIYKARRGPMARGGASATRFIRSLLCDTQHAASCGPALKQ